MHGVQGSQHSDRGSIPIWVDIFSCYNQGLLFGTPLDANMDI